MRNPRELMAGARPKPLDPDAMDASGPIGKKLWGGISYTVGAASDDPNDSPAGTEPLQG
jgi:hypothetical protein